MRFKIGRLTKKYFADTVYSVFLLIITPFFHLENRKGQPDNFMVQAMDLISWPTRWNLYSKKNFPAILYRYDGEKLVAQRISLKEEYLRNSFLEKLTNPIFQDKLPKTFWGEFFRKTEGIRGIEYICKYYDFPPSEKIFLTNVGKTSQQVLEIIKPSLLQEAPQDGRNYYEIAQGIGYFICR